MAVMRRGKSYGFDFLFRGRRYQGSVERLALARGDQRVVAKNLSRARSLEAWYREELAAGRDPLAAPAAVADARTMTIGEYMDKVYTPNFVERRQRVNYRLNVASNLNVLKPIVGHMPLDRLLDPAPFDDLVKAYSDRKLATLNRLLVRLKAIRRFAIARRDIVVTNDRPPVAVDVDTDHEDKRWRRIYPDEEERLRAAADVVDPSGLWSKRILAYLKLGARANELLARTNAYVNWLVTENDPNPTVRFDRTKNGEDRCVPFAVDGELGRWLQGRRFLGPGALVFGTVDGKPLGDYKRVWENILLVSHGYELRRRRRGSPRPGPDEKVIQRRRDGTLVPAQKEYVLKVIDLHIHDFRREAALRWIEQGRDIESIRLLLGHKHLPQTQGYLRVKDTSVNRRIAHLVVQAG